MEVEATPTPVVETPTPAPAPEAPANAEASAALATPEAPKVSKEDEKLAGKYAALARKERDLRQKENEIKRLQKEVEEAKNAVQPLLEKKKRAKDDPLGWLAEAELDYDSVTAAALKAPNPQESKLKQMEEKLKELQAKEEARQKEMEAAAAQKEIETFRGEIAQHIDANAEKYELVKAFDGQEIVYNVILEELARTGSILSFDDACELVENHLQDQVEANAKRLQQTKKVGSLFAAAQAALKQNTSAKAEAPETQTTLTNAPDSPAILDRELTLEERKKEAAKLLRFASES